jgi:hypothetical protein
LRFDKKLKNNYLIKLNFDYIYNNNAIKSFQSIDNILLSSNQKFNEFSFSPFISKKGNNFEIINSLILTNRMFNFDNILNKNNINQKILTHHISYSLKINEKNSFRISNNYQFEKNTIENKNRHFFLPNITYLSQLDSIVDIEFNYKRKIIRPSINSLSNNNYVDIYGNNIINQSFILPQIENLYSLDFYKEFKKISINLYLNYKSSDDYITTLYDFQNLILTNKVININDFNEKSIRTSLSVPINKETKLNVNYSISKLKFTNDNNSIDGVVNYYDASISGPIFKNYLYSINSFFIDRFYEYNAFYKANPDFSFSISKNYLNEKLNLNIEFRNVLNQDSNRIIDFKDNSNFYFQNINNQSRLFLINLTYNFGKDFKISKRNIQNLNNEIKLK